MTSPYWQGQIPTTIQDSQWLNDILGASMSIPGGPGYSNPLLDQFLSPYGGSFNAPVTQAQNTTLGNIAGASSGNFDYNPTAAAEQQQLLYEMQNPAAFGQTLAGGLPVDPGMAALAADPNAAGAASARGLQSLLPGVQDPNAAGTNASDALIRTLMQNNPQLAAMLQPGYAASLATGQPTQSVIDAALQPIKSQFQAQTLPGLIGQTAGAGQRGAGGSSAFNMAFGNAQSQELATEAATSGDIVKSVYGTGLNLAGATANNVAGLQSGAFGQGYGGANMYRDLFANLTGGAYGQGYGASANAQQLLQGERANLYGAGVNASLNAPGALNTLNSSQISDLVSTLNAQALPQLTQQLGINNALSTYNQSINSLLAGLGLQIQAEQPVIGYGSESVSNSASFQNEESSGQQSSFNFGIPGLV